MHYIIYDKNVKKKTLKIHLGGLFDEKRSKNCHNWWRV